MTNIHRVHREIDELSPETRVAFAILAERLAVGYETGVTKTCFKLFETYRSPERQDYLFRVAKTTKAGPWQSPHQHGMAADFVPFVDGKWSWDLDHDWEFLRMTAEKLQLVRPLKWDLAHIEHRRWSELKRFIK